MQTVPLLVGMVTAAVVGFFAIKLLRWMVSSNRLIPFVVYTAVVGLAAIVVSLVEQSAGVNLFTGVPL